METRILYVPIRLLFKRGFRVYPTRMTVGGHKWLLLLNLN